MDAKTLIVITLKSGREIRVNSSEEMLKLLQYLQGDLGIGIGFKDIDGSFSIFNIQEYETIEFVPHWKNDATP